MLVFCWLVCWLTGALFMASVHKMTNGRYRVLWRKGDSGRKIFNPQQRRSVSLQRLSSRRKRKAHAFPSATGWPLIEIPFQSGKKDRSRRYSELSASVSVRLPRSSFQRSQRQISNDTSMIVLRSRHRNSLAHSVSVKVLQKIQ